MFYRLLVWFGWTATWVLLKLPRAPQTQLLTVIYTNGVENLMGMKLEQVAQQQHSLRHHLQALLLL
jgi:hypothetical protein